MHQKKDFFWHVAPSPSHGRNFYPPLYVISPMDKGTKNIKYDLVSKNTPKMKAFLDGII